MSDDTISRQAAIDAIYRSTADGDKAEWFAWVIGQVPSVQPERKTGKWIDEPVYKQTMDGKTWDGYTYCSECGDMKEYGYRSSFCPNCGARMER